MFTVVAICDTQNASFGTYSSHAEALSVMKCIDDYQLPDRCIDVVIHPGSLESVTASDYV